MCPRWLYISMYVCMCVHGGSTGGGGGGGVRPQSSQHTTIDVKMCLSKMCVSKCVRGACIYLCMSVCVSMVVSWTPQQHHCNINSNRDKYIKGTATSVMYATIVVYHNIISITAALQQHHNITVALQQHYIRITAALQQHYNNITSVSQQYQQQHREPRFSWTWWIDGHAHAQSDFGTVFRAGWPGISDFVSATLLLNSMNEVCTGRWNCTAHQAHACFKSIAAPQQNHSDHVTL